MATEVRARIDERVKKEASQVLENMGLSVSDAICMARTWQNSVTY